MIPVWGILQLVQFIRDEILPQHISSLTDSQQHYYLIPKWPWHVWIIGWLSILLIALAEGTFRIWKREQQEKVSIAQELERVKASENNPITKAFRARQEKDARIMMGLEPESEEFQRQRWLNALKQEYKCEHPSAENPPVEWFNRRVIELNECFKNLGKPFRMSPVAANGEFITIAQSWRDLEKEFKSIGDDLSDLRLDRTCSGAREHWRLAGESPRNDKERFAVLAEIAGRKLLTQLRLADHEEIREAPDDLTRWYRALWHWGSGGEVKFVGEEVSDDSQKVIGHVIQDRITKPQEVSALVCLKLQSRES